MILEWRLQGNMFLLTSMFLQGLAFILLDTIFILLPIYHFILCMYDLYQFIFDLLNYNSINNYRSHAERPWIRLNGSDSTENEKAKEAYRALKTISLRRSDLAEYKNFELRVKERGISY